VELLQQVECMGDGLYDVFRFLFFRHWLHLFYYE
jgi:hypothetical protein